MKRIKEILGEDLSGWTFSLGMVICMIFSIFVQVAVFVCFLITVVWFGFNHIKDRDTDGCLLFLSGAFVAQILIWLM